MLAARIVKSQAKDAANVMREGHRMRALGPDREERRPLLIETKGEEPPRLVDPRRSVVESAAPSGDPRPTSGHARNSVSRPSARWSWDFGKIPLFAPDRAARPARPHRPATPLKGVLQTKLVVGAVNDPLEREADAVADAVMRMADPALSISVAPPQVSRKCAECEEEDQQSCSGRPQAPQRATWARCRR
jgi:hypothetical protein